MKCIVTLYFMASFSVYVLISNSYSMPTRGVCDTYIRTPLVCMDQIHVHAGAHDLYPLDIVWPPTVVFIRQLAPVTSGFFVHTL